jgi:carbonic anhydrase
LRQEGLKCARGVGEIHLNRLPCHGARSVFSQFLLADKAGAKENKTPPKPQNVLSADASVNRLLEGNSRYVEGVTLRHDFKHEREALAGVQNPYVAVLSCAYSRIAPRIRFR